MFFRGQDGRDAILRDPALQVSTAFFAHDRRNYWFCNVNWRCEPGSRRSASLRSCPRTATTIILAPFGFRVKVPNRASKL
jgi:hypothetical protein